MKVVVGKRFIEKDFFDLYVGSSVVAGNAENVKIRNTNEKGEPFKKTVYLPVDNLELIEVYKGFLVQSKVAPNVVYEILYDALEGEVKGVLCGVKEENGIAYYALVPKGAKSIKKLISFYIEYVDINLLARIQKEVEEILNNGTFDDFETISERIYAGTFVGDRKNPDMIVIVPFATYKPNEVIPAFTGEEDERISELEIKLEEINKKIAEIEDTESEEYKQLQEKRREILRELGKLRNRLYNPDILKAVRDTKAETKFVSQKPEIRYLGENLIQTAYLYKNLKKEGAERIKGVYAVITLPVYNNLSKQLQRSYLELFLCLYGDNEILPADLQKARQTVSVMDEVLKELIKSIEAGTKPDLTIVKERIKDNLSLRKRVEDLEKFVLLKQEEEENGEVLNLLKELKAETERGRQILYSPFTNTSLITATDLISLLQESGLNTKNLTKEDWQEFFKTLEVANKQIETLLKENFEEFLPKIVQYFINKIQEGKIVYKTRQGIDEYPRGRNLEIIDFQPNRVFQNITETILRKINKENLLNDLKEFEIFFLDYSVSLEPIALKVITRFLINEVAKEYFSRVEGDKERVEKIKQTLIDTYTGNYRREKTKSSSSQEIEIEDLPDFFTESEEFLEQLPREKDDFELDGLL